MYRWVCSKMYTALFCLSSYRQKSCQETPCTRRTKSISADGSELHPRPVQTPGECACCRFEKANGSRHLEHFEIAARFFFMSRVDAPGFLRGIRLPGTRVNTCTGRRMYRWKRRLGNDNDCDTTPGGTPLHHWSLLLFRPSAIARPV